MKFLEFIAMIIIAFCSLKVGYNVGFRDGAKGNEDNDET